MSRGAATLRSAATLLLGGSLLGCPAKDPPPPTDEQAEADPPAVSPQDPQFRREAHLQALTTLRETSMPALRQLYPVAAWRVEGTPLRPPGFGASTRVALREPLEQAQRDAAGIKPVWLSPPEQVVLRMHLTALDRGLQHLRRPPWRDDPSAVIFALEPYLEALERELHAGRCADGCGIEALGPTLQAGLAEVGAASPATVAATDRELAALAEAVPRWIAGKPPQHPAVIATPTLLETIEALRGRLKTAAEHLAAQPERPWDVVVPRAQPAEWARRPARWGPDRLKDWLTTEEAFGHDPKELFDRSLAAAARLQAMLEREGAKPDRSPELGTPFDASACTQAIAPVQTWLDSGPPHLRFEDPCAAVVHELAGLEPDAAAIVLRLVERGVIEPTRQSLLQGTPPDLALIHGRGAPLAQAMILGVSITAGTQLRGAELAAIRRGRDAACQAAAALWIHGGLGEDEALGESLDPLGCEPATQLIERAEARPRRALLGLGVLLLGLGPADAAALDRYWWAPLGLVRDLALPPGPPIENPPEATIEEIEAPPAP